jgi:hypothetical protein
MKAIYDESLRQADELFMLAQQATRRLEEVLGRSGDPVTAEWGRTTDEQGRPVVTLRLSDWAGTVMARFSPAELTHADTLGARLHRLWGDLLQVRSHRQLDKLFESIHSAGGS